MLRAPSTLDFSQLSRDAILELLQSHHLNLTVDEALMIQMDLLKRPPTLAECILWSIQGSEHCSYKSTRKYLKKFSSLGSHVMLGPKEDAGIVAVAEDNLGRRYGIVMSHESHNHPSQIVPFEGAATGVGGNVRDVSCMGAEVIAVADGLRFGDLGRGHTHFIHHGVVNGIAAYGNAIGVPNLAGDLYYHPGYNDNCLVTVVTLGVIREDHIIHSYAPREAEDIVFVLVGKPTDNSGFGGASFASSALQPNSQEQNKGAVQEPNAFLQRHLLKANVELFELLKKSNYLDQVGCKDLGAGGIACASVELADAQDFGADIDLELVPTMMPELSPAILLLAETQERFMWVAPLEIAERIVDHYNHTFALPQVSAGAKAAIIGKIRKDGRFIVRYRGEEIVNARARDITQGILYDRPYDILKKTLSEPVLKSSTNLNATLLALLAHENIAQRTPVFERYDKQVQGRTIIEAGRSDAGVMQPFNEAKYPEEIRQVGIALSLDHNPRYHQIDVYWGAVNAVVESARNVVCVGAYPYALTDCLCFGNPEIPEEMGEFIAGVQGIIDACQAIPMLFDQSTSLPIIAGNVSLYNSAPQGSIPPSPMVSCLGRLPDVSKAITYDLKQARSHLVMVGERQDECGGSVYYQLHDQLGARLPKPDLSKVAKQLQAVYAAIQERLVLAAHDIADGGLAVALAEMSFAKEIGVKVDLPGPLPVEKKLFTETGGFILEVSPENMTQLRRIFASYGVEMWIIGETREEPRLLMNSVIDLPIKNAKDAWENGLRVRLL